MSKLPTRAKGFPDQGTIGWWMTTIANAVITIQTSAHSAPSPRVWFGELTMLAQCLNQQGVLAVICKRRRAKRRRFGRDDSIDLPFPAVWVRYQW